jgi:hypothetical protein
VVHGSVVSLCPVLVEIGHDVAAPQSVQRHTRRSRCGDPLFGESPFCQMAVPQQAIQSALVASQHDVSRAEPYAHTRAVERARAVVLDR